MRHVKLAEQFAEHLGKVVIVADMWQKLAVAFYHRRPVNAMHPLVIETGSLFNSHIIKHSLTLGSSIDLLGAAGRYGGKLIRFRVEFSHLSCAHQEKDLAIFIGLQVYTRLCVDLLHQFRLAFSKRQFPEVITVFKGAEIVKIITVAGNNRVREIRRIGGKAHHAVFDAVKFNRNLFLRLSFFFGIGFAPLLTLLLGVGFVVIAIFLVGLLLSIFQKRIIFFRKHEAVAALAVKENNHYIFLRAPRGVIAHAVAVGEEDHGVAVEHETGIHAEVARIGDIRNLTGLHVKKSYVAVRIAHFGNILNREPAVVGRPYGHHLIVLTGIGLAVSELPDTLCGQIHHHNLVTVFHKRHFLAVGRNQRMRIFRHVIGDLSSGKHVKHRLLLY